MIYSLNEGYHMKIKVYPNVFGTHISVYAGIIDGEYDKKNWTGLLLELSLLSY